MKSSRNLSETTETERTGFPLLRRMMMERHHRASNPRGNTPVKPMPSERPSDGIGMVNQR